MKNIYKETHKNKFKQVLDLLAHQLTTATILGISNGTPAGKYLLLKMIFQELSQVFLNDLA